MARVACFANKNACARFARRRRGAPKGIRTPGLPLRRLALGVADFQALKNGGDDRN